MKFSLIQNNLKQTAIALYKETQKNHCHFRCVCFFDGHQETYVESKKTTPVDTIGAGDSHIGTIMARLFT